MSFLSIMLFPNCAFGQLFAVDDGSMLVTVDPDTGTVFEIGEVDIMGAGFASLEFVGRRLYAVDTNYPAGAWLIEIDIQDGSVLSRSVLTLAGDDLVNAVEGLGYDRATGSMVLGFWQPGAGSASSSNTLGFVGTDGVVTSPVGYGADADFDGLATRAPDGSMYWVDRAPGPNTIEIGVVTHGGAAISLIVHSFDATLNGINVVTLAVDRDELLAVDSITKMVHRFDPGTATLLGSVAYDAAYNLGGIAAYLESCGPDLNGDGVVNTQDFLVFLNAWSAGDPLADWDGDGTVNTLDFLAYLNDWVVGCP